MTSLAALAMGSSTAECSSARSTEFFTRVFGFAETTYTETQRRLLEASTFEQARSRFGAFDVERCVIRGADDAPLDAGAFAFPSVSELHAEVDAAIRDPKTAAALQRLQTQFGAQSSLRTVLGESRSLHLSDETNGGGAVVLAASQFNLLEFPGPRVTPEAGISCYINDKTQGPACAIACAAGTAYRNYLINRGLFGRHTAAAAATTTRGQSADWQLNGAAEVEAVFTPRLPNAPWRVKNGYAESAAARLRAFNDLVATDEALRERAVQLLRIGIQQDTVVTDGSCAGAARRNVTQVYASAMAIGYSLCPPPLWEPAARLVLDGAYEATLLVGVLETLRRATAESTASSPTIHRPPVLLTRVGGGVFGNEISWIDDSIERARRIIEVKYGVPLDLAMVVFDPKASTPSASAWYD